MSAIAVAMLAAILGLVTLVVVMTFSIASSWPIRGVLLALCALVIARSCVTTYLVLERTPEDRARHKPFGFPKAGRGGKTRIAAPLGLSGPFVVGEAIGFLLVTFQRYLNEEEWQAAQAVAAWERANTPQPHSNL